jgi:hemerythrin superfamily protein
MPDQDAIEVLTADHQAIRKLFEEFEGLGEEALTERQYVVGRICHELTVHAKIEEDIFYPRARQAGKEEKDEVLEGIEEHKLIKQLVDELVETNAQDETFNPRVDVLNEQVEHHLDEEEREMFPHVRKALSESELVTLGAQLTKAKSDTEGA